MHKLENVCTRNLAHVHIDLDIIYAISLTIRGNGTHAGSTAFKSMHLALKPCTQDAGCILNLLILTSPGNHILMSKLDTGPSLTLYAIVAGYFH